ncbi:hypothetical protein [Staphylococcus felis]|uniref:Phage protein n=1 Tax=Staphylococcus felis TaxID=46127 RepID=A0ABS0QLI0_9STAP|nr:hypothetical protein [Staphylococcus felis]MBH9580074.1 hypothetical protein [Staphylococcus felis]REI07664.1 hypothetical protein DOS69_05485 [Staphylococcus felis]REI33637.1 hypothetical protein DOS82_05935 [Staphylococcus felis]
MIKIYKNENEELECHVNYAGYDFKFQCIKDSYDAIFKGSKSIQYLEFQSNIDVDRVILRNLQDVMYDIVSVYNWRDGFEEETE